MNDDDVIIIDGGRVSDGLDRAGVHELPEITFWESATA